VGTSDLLEGSYQALAHPRVHMIRDAILDVLGTERRQLTLQPARILEMFHHGDERTGQHLLLLARCVASEERTGCGVALEQHLVETMDHVWTTFDDQLEAAT